MTANDYQRKVETFMNPDTIKDPRRRIINAGLGLSGETGEVNDILKKVEFHSHVIDRDKLKKEAGDVYFYLAELCSSIDTTLEEIAMLNVAKLSARYPNGFNTADSIAKKDENVEPI